MQHDRTLADVTPASNGMVSVDTGRGMLVLSVRGTLDAAAGGALQEAILAANQVSESRGVVVDLSAVGYVTAEGRRALVACVQLAARAQIGLRFRFGRREETRV